VDEWVDSRQQTADSRGRLEIAKYATLRLMVIMILMKVQVKFQRISIESPKLKKRYFSRIASW